MARVKKAMNARKKHKKVLKLAKGFIGSRSKLYRQANTFVMRALGLSYSRFMNGLKLAGVEVNRKMLAEMAIHDAEGFAKLVEVAKSKLA